MDQRKAKGTRTARRPEGPLPRVKEEFVLATDLGDEVVVYDSKNHNGHCLNRSAATVWRNLDGHISMDEMVTRLQDEIDPRSDESMVRLALKELDKADLLEEPLDPSVAAGISRRTVLTRIGVGSALLVPAIMSMVAPPAHAQVSAQGCPTPDTCATFSCPGGCACVPTTEGTTVCIVPTCIAPCTTTADCPPGTVCFTLGCCGPATYCVPIAPAGTNCQALIAARGGRAWV